MAFKISEAEFIAGVREFCEHHAPRHVEWFVDKFLVRPRIEVKIREFGWGTECRAHYDMKRKIPLITWSSTERTAADALAAISAYRDLAEFMAKMYCYISQYDTDAWLEESE